MSTLNFEEEEKLQNFLQGHKYQCKLCGRKEIIIRVDKCLCSHCGYYIYKDENEYNKYLFKLRLRRELKK